MNDAQTESSREDDHLSSRNRLQELCSVLEALTEEVPGLEPISLKENDPSGCSFRYRSDGGSEATLRLTDGHVTATVKAYDHAGTSETRDTLGIELESGFVWDGVEAESAAELAGLLLKHLCRRSDQAVPEP